MALERICATLERNSLAVGVSVPIPRAAVSVAVMKSMIGTWGEVGRKARPLVSRLVCAVVREIDDLL